LWEFRIWVANSLPSARIETVSSVPPLWRRTTSSSNTEWDLRRAPLEERKRELAKLLRKADWALHLNEHIDEPGDVAFRHACKLGFEGIVSKRFGSPYRSGRSRDWIKSKNPAAPSVKGEAEEDWGRERWK
jgi:hypothetical protein